MKIQALNQSLSRQLAQAYHQVSYVDVYLSLLDLCKGQLASEAHIMTDGLHLSVAGYRVLAQALQETL